MTADRTKFVRPRVDELDGLRAILALWVVLAHMLSWCGFWEVRLPAHMQYAWSEFLGGHAAVEVFIILSGFAISFLLHGRGQSYAEFMTGRFFRIYPVYLLCLLAGWASTYLEPALLQNAPWKGTFYFGDIHLHYGAERAHMAAHWFWHLILLNGLIPPSLLRDASGSLLPPAWSITLEWQYYLIAPLIAGMVRSASGLVALIALSLLGQVHSSSSFLPTQLPLFLLGIGSYHLYEWFCRAGQPRSPVLVVPIMGVLALALLSRWHLVPLVLWALAFGSVFLRGGDVVSRLFLALRRTLLHPALQWLGKVSYCIYLAHWPIIVGLLFIFLRVAPALTEDRALSGLIVVGLPVIFGAAALLHRWIEAPAMNLGKTLSRHLSFAKGAAPKEQAA